MHGMGYAGPHVLLYKLTGVVEEVGLHTCIVIIYDLMFGYMIS
jgi:hypothetical protein